ncbi:Rab small monomeric GTPase [Mycena sanguinolenta]|uniref:Rab small monomeric GTPase n=1 Tax=Mycena sanguinolenta TaxID=230812 RepID=A0A8H7DMV5_9AGAR|nr:Rab small monomeric GTPase [Mycena sanguinolenta]
MPTFKVVVIGASGVGKTSLRGQYISARFSTSYRATIGADFITKTLPAPPSSSSNAAQAEPITLQIWDTAGQERFASLASAFFRGADAAILMYDVTSTDTLYALRRWWDEFKAKAPVREEDLQAGRGFVVVVVGNKIDLLELGERDGKGGEGVVTAVQAARFVRALVPRPDTPPASPSRPPLVLSAQDEAESESDEEAAEALASSELTARPLPSQTHTRTLDPNRERQPPSPISILRHPHLFAPHGKSPSQVAFSPATSSRNPSTSRSRNPSTSRDRRHAQRASISTTATSTLTIYHTPSSSVHSDGASEYWHSARSSLRDSFAPRPTEHRPTSAAAFDAYAQDGADSPTTPANAAAQLGLGFPSTPRRNGVDSRSVSEATITPARMSSSSISSASSSRSSLVSESPSPSPTKASPTARMPNGNAKPLPPALDTSTAGSVFKEEPTPEEGPSSNALSPLPYPQHFPSGARDLFSSFGAFSSQLVSTSTAGEVNLKENVGVGENALRAEEVGVGNRNSMAAFVVPGAWGSVRGSPWGAATGAFSPPKPIPTTGTSMASAGSSVDSLLGAGVNGDLLKPTPNGVVNGKGKSPASSSASSLSSPSSSPLANGVVPTATAPPQKQWYTEPEIPSSNVGAAHFRVSARTGEGVEGVFGWVARRLYAQYQAQQSQLETEDAEAEGRGGGEGG